MKLATLVLLFQVYLWETHLWNLNDQHDCEWCGVLQPGGGVPHPQNHEGEEQEPHAVHPVRPFPQGLSSASALLSFILF